MIKIKLSKINIDGGTQPRVNIDEELVSEYANDMIDGDNFPPIVLFNDGVKYWLADGFHRYHASKKAGFLEIESDVKSGTKRDAVLYSVSANGKHGKRRTNADKRKAVLTLLKDEEWSQWNDSEIARQCDVSHTFVAKMRDKHVETFQDSGIRKVKRGDQEYTVDTSNIGNGSGKSNSSLLDDPSDFEEKEVNGYDFPENAGTNTGQVSNERKGIGLEKAHEAISKLKQIPPNDGLLQDAYDTVIQWINYNR